VTTMGAAKTAYRTMLREAIAPALRNEGLKGSGQAYEVRGDRHVGRVTFEASARNTADRVRFRVFLSVEPRASQSPMVPSRSPDIWDVPLARLIPSRPAFEWWLLRDGDTSESPPGMVHLSTGERLTSPGSVWASGSYDSSDPAAVAADVLAALKQWGLPALRHELARREGTDPK
jgi:hypothetical protein